VDGQAVTAVLVFVLLLALVGGPVLTLVWMSFRRGMPGQASPLTLENFTRLFGDAAYVGIIANTLVFALLTLGVMFLFLLPLTFLLTRTDLPFRWLFIGLFSVVILVPTFLRAIGWIMLLSPQIGLINKALMAAFALQQAPLSIFGMLGMAFVQGLSFVPGAFFMLSAAHAAMDPSLEEAAYTSGLGRLRTFLRVNLPLTAPATLGVFVYFFMLAVSVFETPAIIGLPVSIHVLSSIIYLRLNPNVGLPDYGGAGAFGMVLLLLGIALSWVYFRAIRHSRRYAVVSGKGYRPRIIKLGRWKPLALAFVVFFFLLEPGLPLGMLVWTSLTPYMMPPSVEALRLLSFDNYAGMFAAQGTRMIYNTVFLVALAPLLAMVLSILVAWIVTRTRSPLRGPIDVLAFLPHAVPSILFAVALNYLALVNREYFPLYGTVLIIILAHGIAFLAFGSRTLNSVMVQIHRELEEAGRMAGLTALRTLMRIVVPIVAMAVFNSWFWIALLSYREVTMALLLYTQKNDVIATGIWHLWVVGRTNEVAALGTVLVLVALGLGALASLVVHRFGGARSTTMEATLGR
jgi:iron(III) transport system permease protein